MSDRSEQSEQVRKTSRGPSTTASIIAAIAAVLSVVAAGYSGVIAAGARDISASQLEERAFFDELTFRVGVCMDLATHYHNTGQTDARDTAMSILRNMATAAEKAAQYDHEALLGVIQEAQEYGSSKVPKGSPAESIGNPIC